MNNNIFRGRRMVIATMHGKEKLIAPAMKQHFGLECFTAPGLNTDQFGTFSGEVRRLSDPLETARQKCLAAMELTGATLALASEGSFGMHPSIFFAPADSEILLLMDKENNLEIVTREISTETNFSGSDIRDETSLLDFAERVRFPDHGIILRKSKADLQEIHKGIRDKAVLLHFYRHLQEKHGTVYAETDMRAMHNPMRQSVISNAVQKLITRMQSTCPVCTMPGFGVTLAEPGLPCSLCGSPTRSTLKHISSCAVCGHSAEQLHPHKRLAEDPMYCDHCNP